MSLLLILLLLLLLLFRHRQRFQYIEQRAHNADQDTLRILQGYRPGLREVSRVLGIHHQYVRKAASNLVRVTVENNGDVERLRQMYTEGFASCGWRECGKAYNAYKRMIEQRFRTDIQGVAMHRPNESGYIHQIYTSGKLIGDTLFLL